MYAEDDFVMISALQHYLFCPRQCALIHVEQLWTENQFTAEGRVMHERVHKPGSESRRTIKTEFDVPLRSFRLGLVGRADIVEFHKQDGGLWRPYPVEYKRGRPKRDNIDKVQLCAQALCLSEMLKIDVPAGALYYGQKKKRMEILFETALCNEAVAAAEAVHHLLTNRKTPPPVYFKGCESCSFIEHCLPEHAGKQGRVEQYIQTLECK